VKKTGKQQTKGVPDKTKALLASWDTCVFLAWLKNEQRAPSEVAGIQGIAKQIQSGDAILMTSALTRGEIYQGRLTKAQRDKLKAFFRRSNVYSLPLDDRVGDLVAEIREYYASTDFELLTGDSGARRKGFRGERENDSGVKTNRIPG
jgi:hypothetical protein